MRRVAEDLFDVVVPPVCFFDLWVQPRVRCRVRWDGRLAWLLNGMTCTTLPCTMSGHMMGASHFVHMCRLLDEPDRVDIQCVECKLFGSPAVEQLKLNDRIQFNVHTVFTSQTGQSMLLLRAITSHAC